MRRLNSFSWPTLAIKILFGIFFAIMIPIYIAYGVSVFATTSSGNLNIPAIDLDIAITDIQLTQGELITPRELVGRYRFSETTDLLIAHNRTAFGQLHKLSIGDQIIMDGSTFTVTELDIIPKHEIDMRRVLQPEQGSAIVLMTCAGEYDPSADTYSARLILRANKDS